MSKPIKVLICVLTTHERVGWVSKQLSEFLTDLPFIQGEKYQCSVSYCHNHIPAAAGRNFIAEVARNAEPRPDWLLMIDNDMAPYRDMNPLDTLENAPADADILVPQFQMWDESKASVTLCWGMDELTVPKVGERQFFTIEPGRFYPLTKCGTGFIFIRPHVFDKLELPYFAYPLNKYAGIMGTEDIDFCQKALKAGLKMYGNSSIRVGHYHNVNLDVVARMIAQLERDWNSLLQKELDKVKTKESESTLEAAESPSLSLPVAAASPA